MLAGLLAAAFAVAVGDFGFRTWHGSMAPDYMLKGMVRPLVQRTDGEPSKHLYLRRTLRLTEAPEQAWIQFIGHDFVEAFVNGRRAALSPIVGYNHLGGAMMDITSLLHEGENSIAVHVPQMVLYRPPAVAIGGELRFADGEKWMLGDADQWRATNHYDRQGTFWYETAFNDDHWSKPAEADPVYWRAQVYMPPRSISRPRDSTWVSPPDYKQGAAAMARTFIVSGAPREGWLRVLTNGAYRVAVNGYLAIDQQENLGIVEPARAREHTYDISPLLRAGVNTVSIHVETPGESPRLLADLEATTHDGERTYVATDGQWYAAAGFASGWMTPSLAAPAWQPCQEELGYLGVVPRAMLRELVEIRPETSFWFARGAAYAAWLAATALAGALGAGCVSWLLNKTRPDASKLPAALPYVALAPSAIAAGVGALMTWDLSWTVHDVYQPLWFGGLWLLVAMQWLLLVAMSGAVALWKAGGSAVHGAPQPWRPGLERAALIALCLALGGLAFWLRARDILAEPIHHDEVSAYAFTDAIFEQGFPGGQVHPDIPFGYVATNELVYYFNAVIALFTDDPLLIIRVPALLFSMATLALVGYVGWKWFDGFTGFVAATLFALSPHIISISIFGRYLAQTQFFTLLTIYLTYEAVRGSGPPNIKLMWGATVSFIAMYLSWEGTGMIGPALALAVFFQRRRNLKPLLASLQLYLASTVLLTVVVAQNAHRIMQQTQRLWYGEGISSLTIKPMWRYPFFQHDYFLLNSSWTRDALLPMLALAIACVLAIGHRWRFPLRFILISLIGSCVLMAALLPLRTNRYAYQFTELMILLSAAVAVAGAESLLQLLKGSTLPTAYRRYAWGVSAAGVLAFVAVTSGWTLRTAELTRYSIASLDVRQLRVPDWDEPTKYLLDNLREGDVVISIFPHTTNYMFIANEVKGGDKIREVDYWLQSRLILQATLGDATDVPRDRRSGAVMLHSIEEVEKMFADHPRVWYLTMRTAQSKLNDGIVSQYLRQHMDVVSEDYATALMVRDSNHRPAPIRLEEEEAGHLAADYYLK